MSDQRLHHLRYAEQKVAAGSATWHDFARALGTDVDNPQVTALRAFQGSLDAAKELHEAVLPGKAYQFIIATEANFDGFTAEIYGCNEDRFIALAGASNPARAWLLAIIRALIEIEGVNS